MENGNYLRSVSVLFGAFAATAAFAVILIFTAQMYFDIKSNSAGLALFAVIALFMLAFTQHLAKSMLFAAPDFAPLQVLGGVRMGSNTGILGSGRGATWPFTKLSASQELMRVQTPFGSFSWENGGAARPSIRRTGLLPGGWTIGDGSALGTTSITFVTWPWLATKIERKLQELGFLVAPRA
jgi:hypothetical protein